MAAGSEASYEILEHTADLGLRARGRTLEELFENAAHGTLEILGARAEEGKDREKLSVEADDREALLVHFLDELIYLIERYDACIASVEVTFEKPTWLIASLSWSGSPCPREGTELKGTTYHQLSVGSREEGFEATVYFDV